MKFYKFLILFFILIAFFMSINLIELQSISKDNTPLVIKIITPTKSQDYIISKPTIKASFYSKNGINLNSIKLYVNNKDVTNKAKIKKDNLEYTPDKKFKRGTQIVKIIVCDKSNNKESLEWYFTVGTPIYKTFKGNFIDSENINNICSKMYRSPELFKLNDYCVINNTLDYPKKKNDEFKNTFKKYAKDNFVLFDSLKLKSDSSKSEIVIYNTKENENYKGLSNLTNAKLYKNLFYKDELICSFNPTSNDLNLFDYMKYSTYGDSVFSLINITDNVGSISSPFYLKIYNEALDNGWHISPISNKYTTNILCTDLNKDGILNALKNRRTYVSNNKNLDLEFNINSSNMGSTIKNPSKLNFNISAIDTSYKNKINNIYIMSNNNKVIKNIKFNSYLAKSEFSLKEFEKYSYYYLIIKQDNNKTTISAPIWVEIR